jgi:hypothetical protein
MPFHIVGNCANLYIFLIFRYFFPNKEFISKYSYPKFVFAKCQNFTQNKSLGQGGNQMGHSIV